MANIFNDDVHRQFYIDGVQEENRDALPMKYVSEIETDNAEFIYNRYGEDMTAQNSDDSSYTTPGFTYTADSKLIDKEAIAADRVTYKELSRQGFDIVADRKDKHAFAIAKACHRNAAREQRLGASEDIDEVDVLGTGSAGDSFASSSTNADDIAATAVQKLQESNCYTERNPFAMMSPKNARNFNLFSMGAGFGYADKALEGSIFTVMGGTRIIQGAMGFGGLDVIVTNETAKTSNLTFSGNPTANDTVTVNGVVFTFVAAPSAAGDVDLGADAEGSIDNLVAAINGGAGAGTAYVEVAAANRTTLQDAGMTARKVSATVLELESFSTLTVAESGSNTAWDANVVDPIMAAAYNSTTIALPSAGANVVEKEPPLFSGIELMFSQQHDATVWTKNAPKIKRILTQA